MHFSTGFYFWSKFSNIFQQPWSRAFSGIMEQFFLSFGSHTDELLSYEQIALYPSCTLCALKALLYEAVELTRRIVLIPKKINAWVSLQRNVYWIHAGQKFCPQPECRFTNVEGAYTAFLYTQSFRQMKWYAC